MVSRRSFRSLPWLLLLEFLADVVAAVAVPKPLEASPHKRRLKCDTKHQSQEADATFITSDGSKPYKPWWTLDTDNDND